MLWGKDKGVGPMVVVSPMFCSVEIQIQGQEVSTFCLWTNVMNVQVVRNMTYALVAT